MNIVSGLVLYFLIWWTVIFVTLPFGARRPDVAAVGHAASAPDRPRMRQKVVVTTIISTILWFPASWAWEHQLATMRAKALEMSIKDHQAKSGDVQ